MYTNTWTENQVHIDGLALDSAVSPLLSIENTAVLN